MSGDYRADAEKLLDVITLDSELNKIKDVDILLERILTEARRVVQADAGSIYIKKADKLAISYAQNASLQRKLPKGNKLIYKFFEVPIDKKSISGYVAATGELLNISDVYELPEGAPYGYNKKYDQLSGYRSCSMLTIPLKTNNNDLLGVIQFINKIGCDGVICPFTREDEILVTHFAANVTVALQRAQMTRAILLRMISMAELRDPKETGPHVNRVAGFSVEIYEKWALNHGVSEDEIQRNRDNLRMAAMLHDVGKVAISDLILKKPARFNDEEYEIMKTHTLSGAKLFVDNHSELDDIAREIVLTHHENWDGSGYPGYVDIMTNKPLGRRKKVVGRKGTEIPLFGRIVAIADVYDALRSKRVYKEAWSEDDVLSEMRSMRGTKFDPELVDIFFEVLPSIQTIAEKYADKE
ncbi:phosphohydrolase [Marispirochaeta aestuarii]|uniref:Phosphohydrolase n=1 Tax=Marispirochaeta aestuarii TaxID=1963862 RepID=A0A1Y1S3G0_9SPIO|nr:HD domain-containing phosphohydrolase [Marispirochaeta aestuarii]ORC37931.1 phosphohydrolase [Marispirochaeta aestuarii]